MTSASAPETRARTGYRRTTIVGSIVLALMFGGVGGFLALAEIAGAVVAPATVVVRGQPKTVQHLDGGIVAEIRVADGDLVEAGAVLVRLDDTLLRANVAIFETRLREARARRARLEAERDDDVFLAPPPGLAEDDPHLVAERRLFDIRALAREGERARLAEQIAQLESQRLGMDGLGAATRERLAFYEEETTGLRDLVEKGFAPRTRLLALERDRVEAAGALAQQAAEVARIENAIAEARIALLQLDRGFREEVLSELRAASLEVDEFAEQLYVTRRQLERIEVVAPVTGHVHELTVFTLGGVVAPGGMLMQIVPAGEGLELEALVEPREIDRLAPAQAARVRFASFDHHTTPELDGHVLRVSPKAVVEEATGRSFYRVVVYLSESELARLEGRVLVPGMPADVFVTTGDRSILSFLLKPIVDQLRHAMRER